MVCGTEISTLKGAFSPLSGADEGFGGYAEITIFAALKPGATPGYC